MKRTIFILFLLLPIFTSAQETEQWTKTLQNQTKAKYSFFNLPPLEDEVLPQPPYNKRYMYGIRFTIQPSFNEQVTYEFLYSHFKQKLLPEDKEIISQSFDLENVLFRKYNLSDNSKEAIHKYHDERSRLEKEWRDKYPRDHNLTPAEKDLFDEERRKALNKITVPDQLDVNVTDKFIRDFHSKMTLLVNKCLYGFNNYKRGGGNDGTSYIIEVRLSDQRFFKFSIWSPREKTEEGKFVAEMLELVNSL